MSVGCISGSSSSSSSVVDGQSELTSDARSTRFGLRFIDQKRGYANAYCIVLAMQYCEMPMLKVIAQCFE